MSRTLTRRALRFSLAVALGAGPVLADAPLAYGYINPVEIDPSEQGVPLTTLQGSETVVQDRGTVIVRPVPRAEIAPAVPPAPVQLAEVTAPNSVLTYPAGAAPRHPGYVVRSTIVRPFSGQTYGAPTVTGGEQVGPWIFFRSGSSKLTAASKADVNVIGQELIAYRANPNVRFLVTGFTDAKGSAETNRRIATARAESVRRYLSAQFGLPAQRFLVQGVGEEVAQRSSKPLANLHRRVTVSVVIGGVTTHPATLAEERCTLPATPYGQNIVRGRLVASTFQDIDDFGGGRLIEYCDLSGH